MNKDTLNILTDISSVAKYDEITKRNVDEFFEYTSKETIKFYTIKGVEMYFYGNEEINKISDLSGITDIKKKNPIINQFFQFLYNFTYSESKNNDLEKYTKQRYLRKIPVKKTGGSFKNKKGNYTIKDLIETYYITTNERIFFKKRKKNELISKFREDSIDIPAILFNKKYFKSNEKFLYNIMYILYNQNMIKESFGKEVLSNLLIANYYKLLVKDIV